MPLSSKRAARVVVLGQSEPSSAGIGALNRQNRCSWVFQEKRHEGPQSGGHSYKGGKVVRCPFVADQWRTTDAAYRLAAMNSQ